MSNFNGSEDILRPLSDDEAEQMMKICAQNLPLNLRAYSFLLHLLLWNKRLRENPQLNDKIVSPYMRRQIYTKRGGKLENCTFISISEPADYNLFISSLDKDELKECLLKTKLINWKLFPYFTSFEGRHRANLVEVLQTHGVEITKEVVNSGNYVTCEDALAYHIEIPDDVVVGPLKEDDIRTIDDAWLHKYDGSYASTKTFAAINDSFGIYCKITGEIRSWVIITEQFTPGMLHTVPKHRGKGYAKLIMKLVAKLMAEKYGVGCYVFIFHGNVFSESLFRQSLGYKNIPMPNNFSWIWTKKQLS